MPRLFKTEQLQDESLRKLYDYILVRANHIFDVFRSTYLQNSKNKNLSIEYFYSTQFQAEAFKKTANDFKIGIHSPTILLSRTLFDVLMTHESYGGRITGKLVNEDRVKFRLIHDVRNIYKQKEVEITNDTNRILVSSVLTDLTGTFIALHEIGHVVLGHVETINAQFGDDQLLEIFSFKRRDRQEAELRQGMEHDADMIATRLIPQYIEQLYEKIQKDKRYQAAFREICGSEHPFEQLTSVCTSAIYAIFLYMFGPHTVKDFRYTAHHHPLTRIQNVVNGIIQTLDERWDFDLQYFDNAYENRLSSIHEIFTAYGMINPFLFNRSYVNNIGDDLKRIQEVAFLNRQLSQPWSWLPDTEWMR